MEYLNKILKENIEEYRIRDIDELIFLQKLIDIIRRHVDFIKRPKVKQFVKVNKSFEYSYQFLKSICPRYAEYLLNIKEQGIFDINFYDTFACSTIKNGKHYIYLPLQQNIGDTYTITHETIHDMTATENTTITRHFFCEVFSLLAEILQKDYFERTCRPKEYYINNLESIQNVYQKSVEIKLELDLIKQYLKYGWIESFQLSEIFQNFKRKDWFIIENKLYDFVQSKKLEYGFQQRYIIGYLIACYMHARILKDAKKIQEFIELNDCLNEIEIEDFFHYLDLEYKENKFLDLTDESYQVLEKSLLHELKRR